MQYKTLKSIYYKDKAIYQMEYEQRKNSLFSYSITFDIKGKDAFVVCGTELVNLVYDISKLNNDLISIKRTIPLVATNSYIRECLSEEINLTNEMEGVRSTKKEIAEALDNSVGSGKKKRFEGLAKKYFMLLDKKKDRISLSTCQDIRDLYDEIVLPEIDDNKKPDSDLFRKESVSVESSVGKELHRGLYPEEKIIQYMEKALAVLKQEEIPQIIRIAVFHYLIGYIHPFYDGNGRLNRFISSYLLSSELTPLVSCRLSYIIKNNKNAYYEAFEICNDKKNLADLTPFVLSFLSFIKMALVELIDKLEKGMEELAFYIKKIDELEEQKKINEDEKELQFLFIQNKLFSTEPFDMKKLEQILNKSNVTINKYFDSLTEKGFPVNKKRLHKKIVYDIDLEALTDMFEHE